MSINDLTPEKLEKGIYKKYSFLKDQVEVSETTNKLILPISVQETASQTIFRKDPESKKDHYQRKELQWYRRVFLHRRHAGDCSEGCFCRHQHL